MAKAPNPSDVVVGLDVGRSGVKLAFAFGKEVKTHFIPSVVIPAKTITYDTNPRQTRDNTVEIDGQLYFVGETAIEQGAQQTVGLTEDWLNGIEHRALLARSKTLLLSYGVTPKLIVAGLPVNTFSSFSAILFKQVSSVFKCSVQPVPQPWGVLQDCLLTETGANGSGFVAAAKQRFAVIDIGHFTTDVLLMSNHNWIQESSGSTGGMSKACIELSNNLLTQGIKASMIECQEIIKDKRVKEFGAWRDVTELVDKAVNASKAQIVQHVVNLIGSQARTIDEIIIAGGGASIFYKDFKDLWPQTRMADNPRYSVVIGMRKAGLNQVLRDPKSIA